MHMALSADEWLRMNTAFCNRLRAWISGKTCDANRGRSGRGDLRCARCGGLYDQTGATSSILSEALHVALSEIGPEVDEEPEESTCFRDTIGYDLGGLESTFHDEEAIEEALAEMFQDDQEESLMVEAAYRRATKRQKRKCTPRKVAVYIGRCPKCGGFMINSPERHFDQRDDEVYRCFSCSWRTSPVYAWNRENPSAIG